LTAADALSGQKIAILGIANAGKTSIIKTLAQQFNALVKPTTGVERTNFEFLGLNLNLWDFGGQSSYRERYLDNPDRYFDLVSYLFYVVDLQDFSVLDESIEYFRNLMPNVTKHSPEAKFILLFHKADPNMNGLFDLKDIKQNFLTGVAPILEHYGIKILIYETSVYNPMSVITAFSQPLLGQEDIYKKISSGLQAFSQKNELDFTILFTKKFFEIGHYNADTVPVDHFAEVLKEFFQRYDPMSQANVVEKFEIKNFKILVQKFFLPVYNKNFVFYIATGINSKTNIDELKIVDEMHSLQDNLVKVLINIDLYGLDSKI
jgi:GTPase SAR1 family protein